MALVLEKSTCGSSQVTTRRTIVRQWAPWCRKRERRATGVTNLVLKTRRIEIFNLASAIDRNGRDGGHRVRRTIILVHVQKRSFYFL